MDGKQLTPRRQKKKRRLISLSKEEESFLVAESRKRGIDVTELIRRILDQYIEANYEPEKMSQAL